MKKQLDYPFPEELFDADGYPTEEALNYIKNWGNQKVGDDLVFGKFFGVGNYNELVEYIKSLWCYGEDAYRDEDGLFELHTLGWSGNKSAISKVGLEKSW